MTLNGLRPYTRYGVAVAAVSPSGEGPTTPKYMVTTQEGHSHTKPENLFILQINSTSLQITFHPPAPEDITGPRLMIKASQLSSQRVTKLNME